MNCRAWETRHKNESRYVHIVDEGLEEPVIKDIAERLAGSPLDGELIGRDVVGSYLLAEKGHESMSFRAFVPLDSHILDDYRDVRDNLQTLLQGSQVQARALLVVMEKLGLDVSET